MKKALSLFLTFCMALSLLSVPAFAASGDIFNDTEFHISGISEMKEFVSEKLNVPAGDITIHGVEINGLRDGAPAAATGGVVDHGYLNLGDVGAPGTNGKLTGWDNYWTVLNTAKIIDQDSISSLTIYAKKDTWHGLFGKKLEPVTVYLNEEDFYQIPGKLITEINLDGASLLPYEEYTLTYDANGGVGAPAPEKVREDTWYTVSSQKPTHGAVNGTEIVFAGWSLDYAMEDKILGREDEPTGMLKANQLFMNQDFTIYAVWAEDSNKNGMPDYQESAITATFYVGDEKVSSCELPPFGNNVGQAPVVTAPAGQKFVKWVVEGDDSQELRDQAYFTYKILFGMAGGKNEVVFRAVFEKIPEVRYIINAYCGGELVDFMLGYYPEGTVVTEEQLKAEGVLQDPFYYNGSTYRFEKLEQDGTTVNLYYEKEIPEVRYIINAYCGGELVDFMLGYYPEGTVVTEEQLKAEGVLQDPFYYNESTYRFEKLEQDGTTVNLYYEKEIPEVRYIINAYCGGELVDFMLGYYPEGTVVTEEQLKAEGVLQDPFYYNESTYRFEKLEQDGTTVNLYYEKEIPEVRYIINAYCGGELVDFMLGYYPEGTVVTEEQLKAEGVLQDPFYYNGSTYRFEKLEQDGTTVNLYYEKEIPEVRYIINAYCGGELVDFTLGYYPEGTVVTEEQLKAEGVLQDPLYNYDDKGVYRFVDMQQDGTTVNLYYQK